jgi:hypothetical protein
MPTRMTAKVCRVRGTSVKGRGRERWAQRATSPVAAKERAMLAGREF